MIALSQRYTYLAICMSLQLLADSLQRNCRLPYSRPQPGRAADPYAAPGAWTAESGLHSKVSTAGRPSTRCILLKMIEEYGQAFRFQRRIRGL